MTPLDTYKTKYYRYLQRQKLARSIQVGIPLHFGIRWIEKRKYLTKTGIKNYDELSLRDKLELNIKI